MPDLPLNNTVNSLITSLIRCIPMPTLSPVLQSLTLALGLSTFSSAPAQAQQSLFIGNDCDGLVGKKAQELERPTGQNPRQRLLFVLHNASGGQQCLRQPANNIWFPRPQQKLVRPCQLTISRHDRS
jgi:hypothetical protein